MEMHDFLFRGDSLKEGALRVPEVREYVQNRPKTCATWRLNQIEGIDGRRFGDSRLVELVGAWRIPDRYIQGRISAKKAWVNPNYIHSGRYTDMVVECACGALVSMSYGDFVNLVDEHDHGSGCHTYDRMEARAKLHRKRHEEIKRLTGLGWESPGIANRFGMSQSSIWQLATRYGERMIDLRHGFKKKAAQTYFHCVHNLGYNAQEVADIYGFHRRTIQQWVIDFTPLQSHYGRCREASADD